MISSPFKSVLTALIAVLFLVVPGSSISFGGGLDALRSDMGELKGDYGRFYLDGGKMLRLGGALLAAGVMANTEADHELQDYYRGNMRSGLTDGISDAARLPGEVFLVLPAVLGARLLYPDGRAGEWAGRTLRAYFVGGPSGLFLQYSTGGARPEEGSSYWRPFRNNNGLSGHAFLGAVPFITAARMQENGYARWGLYALSTLTGLSRINDDKHYASQALLGWYLAYLSVSAVGGGGGGGAAFVPAFLGSGSPAILYVRAF